MSHKYPNPLTKHFMEDGNYETTKPVTTIGGGIRYLKKPKTYKKEFSFEDFGRDEDGNLILKK